MKRVALLRGVNVGKNQRIGMAELRARLTAAGYEDVRTVGQSGNVVFESSRTPKSLERDLRELIGVEVVVRTAKEFAAVVALDPLRRAEDNGSRHVVTFLSAKLSATAARAVSAVAVEPEEVEMRGREIYSWHPNGLHDSPLAKLLAGTSIGVVATARNWNTVRKLRDLARVQ